MEMHELTAFKNNEVQQSGTVLKVGDTIKSIIRKVERGIQGRSEAHELSPLTKEVITRAMIIDRVFNPLEHDIRHGDLHLDLDELIRFQFETTGLVGTIDDSHEENEIYYHTPAIGVFVGGKPIFLNHNYVEALGAVDEKTLITDIINGVALEKYYIPQSVPIAKEAVARLKDGQGYENLELTTKTGKTISWNSFGNTDGLEIRIGNDITLGKFKNTQTDGLTGFEGENLDTMNLAVKYVAKVESIISLSSTDRDTMIVFGFLGTIIDRIWNKGQFLMNITINDDPEQQMQFNSQYAKALKRSQKEIQEKIDNGTLWHDTYDEDTLSLIEGLMIALKEEGYYLAEFPLIDKEGKRKVYSWLRFLLLDREFGIDRTFGIGTNGISKANAELKKLLGEG